MCPPFFPRRFDSVPPAFLRAGRQVGAASQAPDQTPLARRMAPLAVAVWALAAAPLATARPIRLSAGPALSSRAALAARPVPNVPVASPSPPSVASAVKRLAMRDASRCMDELCDIQAHSLSERLTEGAAKLSYFLQTREPLVRWAAHTWAQHHLPSVAPALRQPPELTLGSALKHIGPWHLTRTAFVSAPGRVVKVLLRCCVLWANRLLPTEAARRRRRRVLAPTLMDIASAYDALR